MASRAAIAPVYAALLARVRAVFDGVLVDASRSQPPAQRAVTVYEGMATQRDPFPRVIVGGGGALERSLHTLGPTDGAKWGGIVEIPVRVVGQYPMTEGQVYQVVDLLKAGVEGQPLTVDGFPRVDVEAPAGAMLSDLITGVTTWEYVQTITVTVHQ